MFDGIIDIAVATFLQIVPYAAIRFESILGRLLGGIKQERHNGVAPDIFGDVLLGVIGTHLCTVVDVLLENVAQHVGIDVAPRSR